MRLCRWGADEERCWFESNFGASFQNASDFYDNFSMFSCIIQL
jgi:hypothetical protein